MASLPRFAVVGLLALAVQPAYAAQEPANPPQPNPALADPVLANPVPTFQVPLDPPLPDAGRAMIDAAFASGQNDDVEAVAKVARMTHPGNVGEIHALLAHYRAGRRRRRDGEMKARGDLEDGNLGFNYRRRGDWIPIKQS